MNEKSCPICHTSIPEHAPGGLCPACVLRGADEPEPGPSHGPTLEKVAAAFPKLEILRLIGHGGMGYVYQARQPELDRMVALKILSPSLRSDPAFEERFAREARVLGKLKHPNIVTLYEHGESGGYFYLLMEFIDGVNLRQAMSAGRFSPEQALAIVPAICDALQSAHALGVWHRDIKPENILLDRDGRVKIADFGIARILGDPERNFTLTRTGGLLGSAAYMAPEQHEKPHDVDHRADIYSLGVVIYEMLTGELPLGRFPLPSQRAEVGKRIDEIVLRTLEKERELRQQSATEVKTDVEEIGISSEVIAERSGRRRILRKTAVKAIGFLLIGVLGFLATSQIVRMHYETKLSKQIGYQSLAVDDAIGFAFSNPKAKGGGWSIGVPLRVMEDWVPNASGQKITLGDGTDIWVRVKVTKINLGMVTVEAAISMDQKNWNTRSVLLDENRRENTARLDNETSVTVRLTLVGYKLASRTNSPKAAIEEFLTAARNRNGRVFENRLSESFKEEARKEGRDPSKTFGDFGSVRLVELQMVDDATAEVVLEATDGSKRRVTLRMILEDGTWKVTEHGL